ncbi:MAG: Na+:solute symporter [Rhizobacter sp.]|nr:Na+:solute symporter [Chlorobiales bacterium]
MHISALDITIIALYFILSLGIGLYYSRRAGKSTSEFFLSGRKQPWWLAGTGMVATTFAADTPLAVAGIVAKNGIAGNWVWWSFVFGGMLTVFFFSRLWRRANILTDLEFIELRYDGREAGFLRGFKAIYFGLFMNSIIIGWVNLAMFKIISIMLPGLNPYMAIIACVGITALYASLSGLWGVSVTDAVQFVIAMTGCIVLAVIANGHPAVAARGGLVKALPAWMFEFFPRIVPSAADGSIGGAFQLTLSAFLAFVGVQWWASWYPGAEPGGGGYTAQRMMSAKDEKHSLFATLWFIVAHYCVRPWPWIVVGLVSVVLYPDLPASQKEDGFVYVMRDVLPSGLVGLLLAAFLAAYMSTLSTHLNWGTSYLLNDFYKRFFKPAETEQHYVQAARLMTLAVMLLSLFITFFVLESISGAWGFILECGAGTGLVLILRWFWWRLNAWSEITSMIAPFVAYTFIRLFTQIQFPESLFYIVAFTVAATLVVTFLTKPVSEEHLKNFYRQTRVGGAMWKKISALVPDVQSDKDFFFLFVDWFFGIVLVYSMLFGVGNLIFGSSTTGFILIAIGLASAGVIYFDFNRRGWNELS